MTESSGGNAIWKFNAACLRAAAAGALGWLFWQASMLPGWELFIFFAAIFGLAAAKQAIIALIALVRLILRQRRWAQYRRQGNAPKADRMANEQDLSRRGILR
ncbi:MAG: hypothetical protein AAF479_10040 [Pseudomonadota bacterium]